MRMNKSDSLSYLSENTYLAEPKIRQQIVNDFNSITKSIRDTELYKRSKILDSKRTSDYWSTNVEMSARVFEDFIANSLFDKNQSNDYLVNLKDIGEYLRNDEYPYLLKDEQKPVFAAIEKLFKDIKTQETDDKNIILYHRSQSTKQAYKKRIDDLYNEHRSKMDGVKVLDSSDILTLFGYKDTPIPVKRWVEDGKLRYIDLQKSPTYSRQTGLKLPVSYRTLRGYNSTIYTDVDLVNYRQANDITLNQSVKRNNQPSTASELSKKISKHVETWKNAPEIEVVQSIDELPKTVKEKIINDNALDVNGIHFNGKVYLVADNISSSREALFVTAHEVLGHYGLRGFFGNKLNPLLNNIYKNNEAVKKQADALVNKYGYDKTLATEEALADMAATNGIQVMPFWNKFVAAFRNFSRKLGLPFNWTDNDIANLLRNTRRFVEQGKQQAANDTSQQYSRISQYIDTRLTGDDYTAKDFASTVTSILSDQLAMNPVPQIVKPAIDAAFNYDFL